MRADAERRRELQRRAFAAGPGLSAAESEELRMLSQPAGVEETQRWVTEPVEGSPVDDDDASTGPATQGVRRHPRWMLPVVLLIALLAGLGIGWLVSPRPAQAQPPIMDAAQQKFHDDLVAEGGFQGGSVIFAGAKHGAAVWTADKGGEKCIILLVDGEHRTECADPEKGSYGTGLIGVQLETRDSTSPASVTAVITTTVTGGRTVLVDRVELDPDDDSWQGQYTKSELELVHALEEDGFRGPALAISGYDGDVPIWTTWNAPICIAVVDPDSKAVVKNCMDAADGATVAIPFRDAVYSARWSESHGVAVSVTRGDAG